MTDSSAVVHWTTPPSPVDNYRIAYLPFEGGKISIDSYRTTKLWKLPWKFILLKRHATFNFHMYNTVRDVFSAGPIFVLSSTGSPMMVTVDGSVFEAVLPNMVPGKTYQVTVSAVKGLEESDPSTDIVTTGGLYSFLSYSGTRNMCVSPSGL